MMHTGFVMFGVLWLTLPLAAAPGQELQRHLPAYPSLQGTVFLRLPDANQRQDLIRLAYVRMAERMREAGSDLDFELEGFRTLLPHEFGGVRLADVITLQGGWSLRWNLQRHYFQDELVGASYRPEWYEARHWPVDPDDVEIFQRATLEEWLVTNATERSGAREMIQAAALTAYEVAASMDGRSRRYKALALWLPSPPRDSKSEFHVNFLDAITPMLNYAMGLALPPAASPAVLRARRIGEGEGGIDKAIGSSCLATRETFSDAAESVGTTNHKRGSHAAIAGVDFECTCNDDCLGRCQATVIREECDDWGDIGDTNGWVHDMSLPATDATVGNTANAIVQGPTCYGGVACAWKECFLFCNVQPTLGASYSGATLEIAFLSPGATSIKRSISFTCAPCETMDSGGAPSGSGGGTPTCPTPDSCSSPILVHFGPGQPRLTDAAEGVFFDIDADGAVERVAWPEAGSETAFLVMDRNGNGRIDDATELFGEHTPEQIEGVDGPNGYAALRSLDAGLDDNGLVAGTLDGWIAAEEAHFAPLRLWFDRNHDGDSQPGELELLSDQGIAKLKYSYRLSHRRDRHGNVFRFTSELAFQESRRVGHTFDVFLLKTEVD